MLAVLTVAVLIRGAAATKAQFCWFRRRSVLGKVATVAVFCALVWRGGAKNDGDRGWDPLVPGGGLGTSRPTELLRGVASATNFPLSAPPGLAPARATVAIEP